MRSRRSSAFSFDSVYALGPSDSARAGFSWTSMKIPSTPAATPAGPSVSMKWASPPERSPRPPGRCTLCVMSKTTG
jgi:hypothetical protein